MPALFLAVLMLMGVADEGHAQLRTASTPLHIVVPLAAGSGPDLLARTLSEGLREKIGRTVIVENRPGAGERLGAEYVAKSAPDGSTILLAPGGGLVVSPFLVSSLPYDATQFAPISLLTRGHLVLVARPGLEAASLVDVVSLARAKPGALTYGSSGIGTPPHLTGELLRLAAGVEMTHVPYKGGLAPAMTDLLAGHIDLLFANLVNALEHMRAGRLKVIAVASQARASELPDVPTIAESYPTVHALSWFAALAPPKTGRRVTDELSSAFREILLSPQVSLSLRTAGLEPVASSPDDMAAFMAEERERWKKVIESANIKPE
ncbi:MAG: Bug family tripartite tricarboxylate transporter substrate binding protein [Xanthobacteraceae bacterium]